MEHVHVYLSHDGARVWPPVLVLDKGSNAEIGFHNLTAGKAHLDLREIAVVKAPPLEGIDEYCDVVVDTSIRGVFHYGVYCEETHESAQGQSHPVIIVR